MGKVKKAGKKVAKAVGNVVHDTGKAVGKAVNQTVKVADKVVDKSIEMDKNVVNSSIKSITDLAKGDIVGGLTNMANVASGGTVDLTGRNQGIVNINIEKYIAKAMGAGYLGASGVGSVAVPVTRKSGLVTQLRKGKGSVGGGSYSEIAKNPLGGLSGKTGK